MVHTIEKKIDIGTGGSSEKTDYSKILEGVKKETGGDQEAEQAKNKAADLLKQIQGTEGEEAKKQIIKKNFGTLPPEIKTAINQLNRKDAEKGLEESYMTIDDTIKNSKNEKGIAGFFGKMVNKILGQ
ncbi:MAG: hypothetical protein NT085_02155 [candidate division SR1 bacterium]|nr:hypothetical protein [candidate division SR1 bacterium]